MAPTERAYAKSRVTDSDSSVGMAADTERTRPLAGLTVCLVACHFHPETSGSGPYNALLADALSEAGATIKVITGVPHYPQWRVMDRRYRTGLYWRTDPHARPSGGVTITRVRHAVPRNPGVPGRLRQEASFAAMSAPVVAATRADVIISVTPLLGASLAGLVGRRGRPFGIIVHDLVGQAAVQSGTASGGVAKRIAAAEYSILRHADRVGIVTPRFKNVLIPAGVEANRLLDVPVFSRVRPMHLAPSAARRLLGWPSSDSFTVVHTGNMGAKQGLEHVLDAVRLANAKYPGSFEFVFVGDGHERRSLQVSAATLEGVRFIDPVADGNYPSVLAAADVLLIHERPGVKDMCLPSKLTSYTTASRPIVAAVADDGITGALLHSADAALVVPNGNPEELINGLQRIRADRDLRNRLIANAARLGEERFSSAAGRQHYVRFAADVAGAGGSRRDS